MEDTLMTDIRTGIEQPVARRSVLVGAVAGIGAVTLSAVTLSGVLPGVALAEPARGRLGDPFTLGVASGDPAPDGFVLWTRLAPAPLAEDGLGGMPTGLSRWSGSSPRTTGSARSSGVAASPPGPGVDAGVVRGARPVEPGLNPT